MKNSHVFLLAMIVTFAFGSSCAYKMGFEYRPLFDKYYQVAIPIFSNKTQYIGAEPSFTNALVSQFHRSKMIEVTSMAQAPIAVEGYIESIEFRPSAVAAGPKSSLSGRTAPFLPPNTILVTEYLVIARVKIFLRRTSDKKILWQSDFINEKTYRAPQVGLETVNTANPLYNHSARNRVLQELAETMMSEAHDRMMESF